VSIDSEKLLTVFFAVAACSWVPHWACHYYRLETASTFIVGRWRFSRAQSFVSLAIYGLLIALNIGAIVKPGLRTITATITGIGHLGIGTLHAYRLRRPFPFEVFGHQWPRAASLREVLIVIPFGILCLIAAMISY
jgi:hypothetical protein